MNESECVSWLECVSGNVSFFFFFLNSHCVSIEFVFYFFIFKAAAAAGVKVKLAKKYPDPPAAPVDPDPLGLKLLEKDPLLEARRLVDSLIKFAPSAANTQAHIDLP